MKDRLLSYVLAGALAVCALQWGLTAWDLRQERRERVEAERERNELAADAWAARQRARGWVMTFGTEDPRELSARLEAMDSAFAADARASRIRVLSLTSLVAELRGQIESQGEVHRPEVFPPELPAQPDSATGVLDDGLLFARWSFLYPSATLRVPSYSVTIPIDLVGSEDGNGRTIVSARSPDSRVSFPFTSLVVAHREPVVVSRCSWTERGLWTLGGAVGGGLAVRR